MGRLIERKKEQGVTLVELMIVVAILGMVMAAMYNMFEFQQRSYTTQDNVAVMQQNVRVGLEYMVKEIRMAGYIPEGIPPNNTSPGDNDEVAGQPFSDGKSETMEEATANTITFQADIDGDGQTETVRYALDYDAGQNSTDLTREVWRWDGVNNWEDDLDGDGAPDGPQVVADNIDTITFTYALLADDEGVTNAAGGIGFDDDNDGQIDEDGELLTWDFNTNGALDNNPSEEKEYIRQVYLTMTARSPNQDSKYTHPTQGDHYRRRTLSSNISLRNMQ